MLVSPAWPSSHLLCHPHRVPRLLALGTALCVILPHPDAGYWFLPRLASIPTQFPKCIRVPPPVHIMDTTHS